MLEDLRPDIVGAFEKWRLKNELLKDAVKRLPRYSHYDRGGNLLIDQKWRTKNDT